MRLLHYIYSFFTPDERSLSDIRAKEKKARGCKPYPFRSYTSRTDTQNVLNPDLDIKICANKECKVRFIPRVDNPSDDPSLCLQCNREEWSQLFTKRTAKPISNPIPSANVFPLRGAK